VRERVGFQLTSEYPWLTCLQWSLGPRKGPRSKLRGLIGDDDAIALGMASRRCGDEAGEWRSQGYGQSQQQGERQTLERLHPHVGHPTGPEAHESRRRWWLLPFSFSGKVP
jgi:hypothetical protein